MKITSALWRLRLTTDCPYCNEWIENILDEYHEQEGWRYVNICQSIDINKPILEIDCPKCKKTFAIDCFEY